MVPHTFTGFTSLTALAWGYLFHHCDWLRSHLLATLLALLLFTSSCSWWWYQSTTSTERDVHLSNISDIMAPSLRSRWYSYLAGVIGQTWVKTVHLEQRTDLKSVLLKWVRFYPTDRTQFVSISGEKSECHQLISCVPHTSVLGPICFTIYTQPLVGIVQCHNMKFHVLCWWHSAIFLFQCLWSSVRTGCPKPVGIMHLWY